MEDKAHKLQRRGLIGKWIGIKSSDFCMYVMDFDEEDIAIGYGFNYRGDWFTRDDYDLIEYEEASDEKLQRLFSNHLDKLRPQDTSTTGLRVLHIPSGRIVSDDRPCISLNDNELDEAIFSNEVYLQMGVYGGNYELVDTYDKEKNKITLMIGIGGYGLTERWTLNKKIEGKYYEITGEGVTPFINSKQNTNKDVSIKSNNNSEESSSEKDYSKESSIKGKRVSSSLESSSRSKEGNKLQSRVKKVRPSIKSGSNSGGYRLN